MLQTAAWICINKNKPNQGNIGRERKIGRTRSSSKGNNEIHNVDIFVPILVMWFTSNPFHSMVNNYALLKIHPIEIMLSVIQNTGNCRGLLVRF